jgi:hypothetical protein
MYIFIYLLFVFLAVVGKHNLRCFVINLYQPRLVEGLLQVLRILHTKQIITFYMHYIY